ncbi:MAG: Protease HtpX [Candidatus Heimdallarchaeota archaeon LC_3]|nr:MAG: Protease HtpX [Candidatus Heimdallarchaeota archaeon LC_3]
MQEINYVNFLFTDVGLAIIGFIIAVFIFLLESYKYLKYKTRSEVLDFSLMGVIFLASYIPFQDLFLSFLSAMLALMVIGVYELREAPVWYRLMGAFTLSYAYVLIALLLEKLVVIMNWTSTLGLEKASQITGFALSTLLWVLLIFFVLFFGRRFILVSRFLSPQYVYLFLYALVYLLVSQIQEFDWSMRIVGIIIVNGIIYLLSGPILTFIFGIKTLEDERVLRLMDEVQEKVKTPVKHIGFVSAPIVNAFAYGPWFDQRIAFIVNDINDFKDEEILGIAAHELAHLKHKHTLLLLFIGWGDQIIRFLVGIPVSIYDFAAGIEDVVNPNSLLIMLGFNIRWNITLYYIVNIIIFAFMVVFIRMFEAQADRTTIEVGYGTELGKALYKLEGFYQGIAGEIGMNAQLLTNKQRTLAEEKRFMGDAANELHNKLMNAPRYGLFMNLIVSHPPTAYRIATILQPERMGIRKLALLPLALIFPFFRKRNLKLLREQSDAFSKLLTEKYNSEWESVDSFRNTTYLKKTYEYYLNRQIIAKNKYDNNKPVVIGKVVKIIEKNNIVEPYILEIESEDNKTHFVSLKTYNLSIFEPNNIYVLKNMSIAKLESFEYKKKNLRYVYSQENKNIKLDYLGEILPSVFTSNSPLVYHSRGRTNFVKINKINGLSIQDFLSSQDLTSKPKLNIKNWIINGQDYMSNEEIELEGKNLIISSPPLFIPFYKRFIDQNTKFIEALALENITITLYSSVDPDIGIHCQLNLEKVDGKIQYEILGDSNPIDIKVKQIDGLVLRSPNFLLLPKNENGFFTRIFMKLSNRSSMKYSL